MVRLHPLPVGEVTPLLKDSKYMKRLRDITKAVIDDGRMCILENGFFVWVSEPYVVVQIDISQHLSAVYDVLELVGLEDCVSLDSVWLSLHEAISMGTPFSQEELALRKRVVTLITLEEGKCSV